MSNYGSYVKAIRKASTHLTEEPFLWGYHGINAPPYGGGDGGRGSLLMSYSFLFKESSHTILHTFEEVGPTAT